MNKSNSRSGAAWRYLKTPSLFLFDVSTSFPFSYYDLAIFEVPLMNNVELQVFEIHKRFSDVYKKVSHMVFLMNASMHTELGFV